MAVFQRVEFSKPQVLINISITVRTFLSSELLKIQIGNNVYRQKSDGNTGALIETNDTNIHIYETEKEKIHI